MTVLRKFVLGSAAMALCIAALPLNGQRKFSHPPRLSDGHPSFSGIWSNATATPLERPLELGDKSFFTPAEAIAFEKKMAALNNRDRRDGAVEADVARAYNEAWFDRGNKVSPTLRTSLVVEPANGRVPALTAAAKKTAAERAALLGRPPTGPEDRLPRERCLVGENLGPPILPTIYNNNFQFYQTPDYLVIVSEMIHDKRIIPIMPLLPMTTKPAHLPGRVRQWLGDSIGHWEGDTLVVETTNFTNQDPIRGSDENMYLVERFTRKTADMILYQFRVEDPTAFAAPWAGEVPMMATEGPLYEYACHEGNRGMEGMLKGARIEEQRGRK